MSWATNTFSEYVIRTAFPQQQWLQEPASRLRYMFIYCLVLLNALTVELRVLDVFSRFILYHFMIQLRDSDILSYYLIHRVITELTYYDIRLLSCKSFDRNKRF
jgi:hypothetical protein